MGRVGQLAGQPVLIVVVCKGVKADPALREPPDGVGDLKIVAVVVGGPEGLVEGVVGDGVEHVVPHPAVVLPVDHLAHEPEILLHGGGCRPQLPHKVKVQHVGAVQAQAVDIEGVRPEADGVQEVILHLRILQIQAGEIELSLPGVVAEGVAHGALPLEGDAPVPVPVGGIPPPLLDIPEGEKLPACVVEDRVDHHPDAGPVAGVHKVPKFPVGAQPPVHQAEIPGVVAVGGGLKQGPYVQGAEAQILQIGDPGVQLIETGLGRPPVFKGGAGGSQRIQMIKYSRFIPWSHGRSLLEALCWECPPLADARTFLKFLRRNWYFSCAAFSS